MGHILGLATVIDLMAISTQVFGIEHVHFDICLVHIPIGFKGLDFFTFLFGLLIFFDTGLFADEFVVELDIENYLRSDLLTVLHRVDDTESVDDD